MPGRTPPGFSVSRYLPPKLNNGKALGPAAVTRLSALLCQAERSEYLEDVAEACQRESLQDFCFELFEDWLEQGGAAPEFMLQAVTWLFDDRTLKRLEPLLDEWLEEHRRGLLFKGLRALSKVATSRVVYWLVRALRRWEGELVVDDLLRDIVEGTGIEKETLIDASIPHLDLNHDSGLTLDLGTRFLKLDLEESWRPVLRDMDGHVLENWPSPRPADDPDLSERAKEQYLKVKAELNELVPLQGRRLELALSQQRRWSPQGFRSYIWDHPLTYRLARHLVWGVYGERGLEQSFCIESPDQLATLAGETFPLPEAGQIGICHPLDWSQDERLDWYRRGFDEQPLKQTLRQVFEPEGSETWETRVTEFSGGVVDGQALAKLARDGWDLHYSNKLARRWADGTLSVLEFPVTTPQKLVSLSFLHGKSHQPMDLAHVPPVVYSESILSLNRHLSKDG